MVANGNSALVELSGVHRRFRSGKVLVHALYDISLRVEPGEILAVCGPSGHGKTALANLIGLLDAPSEGSLWFDGLATESLTEGARRQLRTEKIGLVFQHCTLVPVLSAQENVMLPRLLNGKRPDDTGELAAELLARLGLAAQVRQLPSALDASQRQRVCIARALVSRPALVVADEPTSRLDSGSARMVMDLFSAWQRECGTTFVIATRDQRQLLRAARTLQLSEGRLLGAPADTPRLACRALA